MKIKNYLKKISDKVAAAEDAGEEIGACIVANPTGGQVCIQVDEDTCTKLLKGVYLGGACGSAENLLKLKKINS